MKTISIIGQKGGSGKSTLAVHVAVEATARGYVTAAIDADPQKSLYNWFELREAQAPEVIRETDADEMKKAVHRAAKGGCEILVIDTSGRAEATMRQAAELADIVLIPSKLEKFDIDTLPTVHKVAKFAEKLHCTHVILNQVQALSKGAVSRTEVQVREGLAQMSMKIAPAVFHRLGDFTNCLNDGRSAMEFDREGRAGQEARELFSWIEAELGLVQMPIAVGA